MMSTTCSDEKGWAKEGNRISDVTLFSSMKHTKHTMRPVRPAVVKRLSLAGFVPAAAVIINLEATPTTHCQWTLEVN